MSMNRGDKALSSDIKNFKNQVKAEMTRRTFSTSPYSYDGIETEYQADFSQSADAGQLVRAQHYNETVGYLVDKFTGLSWASSKSAGDSFDSLQGAYDYLIGTLKTDPANTNTPHCRASCQGLCKASCGAECTHVCTAAHGNCSWYLGNQDCNQ